MANGLIDFEFTPPHGYFQKLYAHVTEKSLAFAGAFLFGKPRGREPMVSR